MSRYVALTDHLDTHKTRRDEPLARHTTFRSGGPADLLCLPDTLDELIGILRRVTERAIPWVVVGNGSNVLFDDAGFRGVVIKIRGSRRGSRREAGTLRHIERDGERIRAGSGVSLARLAWFCAAAGLSGVEWGTGIPGGVGGAIRGNAGAHGGCMADHLESIDVVTAPGDVVRLSARDIRFRYRHAALPPSTVITGATFVLRPGDPRIIRKRIREYTDYRKGTQPSADQSAGCMFKNPPGASAGRLIDAAGCKGLRIGGAMVSDVHANFIINRGHATAADTRRLMDEVRTRVRERTGITLELEVRVFDEEGAAWSGNEGGPFAACWG